MSRIVDVLVYPVYSEASSAISGYLPFQKSLEKTVRRGYASCFVKVIADDGLYGFGECWVREVPQATAEIVRRLLKNIVIGKSPLETEVLWEEMFASLKNRGHTRGYFIEALAGVDIAIWDLKGKILQRPVYDLLGGKFRGQLKAYASSIVFGKPEEMAKRAREWVDEGHDQIKVKVGMGVERDIENLKTIRDEVGKDVEIMVDANSAYNLSSALKLAKFLERLEVRWFEEPLPVYDLKGYIALKRKVDVPIACGESLFTVYDFRDYIENGVVDIIQPDIARAGGITGCSRIVSFARAYNIQYSPHVGLSGAGCRAATLHLSASISPETFLTYEVYDIKESPNPFSNNICDIPVEVFSKGYVRVPENVGLGLEVNERKLEPFLCK
ncbi:MAG: mandelate racemase/muconate lactonizing enzyme family protein [Nitrososphaeria archaeon]|nr:mandelate racemase/muconate lactonizing enzyme family protein [Nitrososphaeria archaeon]